MSIINYTAPGVPSVIEVYVIKDDDWVVDRIFTEVAHRGKGHARTSLHALTGQADAEGITLSARLLPDGEERERLWRLFESCGFVSKFVAGGIPLDVERLPNDDD